MTRRDNSWDAVKGVAILFMVVAHSYCPTFMVEFIYLFHMGLFYYVSGKYLKVSGLNGGGGGSAVGFARFTSHFSRGA